MKEWQQRIKDEQEELQQKLIKLIQFTKTQEYRNLSKIDRDLLWEQQNVMSHYNQILADRIARF